MEVITYYNKEKFSCNTYILKINETNIIVDPNDDSTNILDFLENNKIKIDYILITHAHFDHIRGLFNIYQNFKCKIVVSFKDYKFLFDDYVNLSLFNDIKPCSFEKSLFKEEDFILINGDETIKISDLTCVVLDTPFHTTGSVCYYFVNEKILFSGDTIFAQGYGRTDLINAIDDVSTIKKSLNKILKLEKNIKIFPGHGEAFLLKDWKF